MKPIILLIAGLMLLQATVEDWVAKTFPSIPIRIIVALLLIYYAWLESKSNVITKAKQRVGL